MTTAFDEMGLTNFPEDLAALRELGLWARTPAAALTRAVEVGSWAGLSALALAQHCDVVYCIDHWEGGTPFPEGPEGKVDNIGIDAPTIGPKKAFQTFCRNVGDNLMRSIIPCVGRSRTWAEIWPSTVDLVYIDASHDYDSVKQDIALWLPHVRDGGIIAGHDYGFFEGVTRAVYEAFGARVQVAGKLVWWVRKEATCPTPSS